MLQENNPEISSLAVNQKIIRITTHRRRPAPLFQDQTKYQHTDNVLAENLLNAETRPTGSQGFRQWIKNIPLIGPFAIKLNRRKKAVFAPNLHWKQRLRLMPLIGALAAWTYSVFHLNKIRLDNEKKINELHQLQELSRSKNKDLGQLIDLASARINQLEKIKIQESLAQVTYENLKKDTQISDLSNDIHTIEHDLTQRLTHLGRQFDLLGTALNNQQNNQSAGAIQNPVDQVRLGLFYLDFENSFRGTRQDIAERLAVYIPYFSKFDKIDDGSVIDIGCGRGEWLELLAKNNINGLGIDLNIAMVDLCTKLGLNAKCIDAMQYLKQLPENSVTAITGFHIIEHLSFEILLELFDSALHVLQPGGFVIFETPNPENLQVGACNFYTDLTHHHPIVPAVAEFIAKQRGFALTEILRLHPYPESHCLEEESLLADRLNTLFYGPQDYAIIAWKQHAN